ncbi:MAG: ABC transporter substrate-binding protein [Candidatus Koribacter versatilis]|uniref:ABC transporter substrate-binding protein n=1 Tax=Candidatus Korobacter versatilis TaxID=658062 RepID=A0A932A794_9BACT|nr:ABC transporter substrate-binding protein [Candidatus Koribacter versatilis]
MSSDHSPRRVVSLQPSATVTLADLGLLDRLVACTKWCAEVVPQIRSQRTLVADSWTADAAEILAVNPDLVIASVPYQAEAVTEILKAGARFLGLAPRTLTDVYADIAAIAGIMHTSGRGNAVIGGMQSEVEAMRVRTRDLGRRRVHCEEWGKPLIHSQPWVAELVTAAGGEFIGTPGAHADAASIAASQPDVIIAAWCGAGDRVPLEKLVRERGWQDLPAVRMNNVYCIADELLNTPASTLIGGLHGLAAAIHPETFSSLPRGLRRVQPTAEPVIK